MGFIIAIDGPAGSGKSTIARQLAARLGVSRVDTGAIYRALTYSLLAAGRPLEEAGALVEGLPLSFGAGGEPRLDGVDVDAQLRTPEVSARVSEVAALPAVRAGLLGLQRRLAEADPVGAVMEGRDIGTVVFPQAPLKVFLSASVEERARRRAADLQAAGQAAALAEVQAALIARDDKDSSRAIAPLKPAEDALLLDSTALNPTEVVDQIAAWAAARGFTPPT